MMLLLLRNVTSNHLHLRKADRKHTITILPSELAQCGFFFFNPEGGAPFEFLDHIRHRSGAGQAGKKVDMVFHPADDKRLAIELVEDATQIAMNLDSKGGFSQKR